MATGFLKELIESYGNRKIVEWQAEGGNILVFYSVYLETGVKSKNKEKESF